MAEVDPIPPPLVHEAILSEGSHAVEATHPETNGEHEATNEVEASSETEPEQAQNVVEEGLAEISVSEGERPEAATAIEDMLNDNVQEVTFPPASPAQKITAKSSISVKPLTGKAAGGAPTPLVKKIINSGTFGSGTVKPTPSATKATAAPATKSASATSALKKATSTGTTKPTTSYSSAKPTEKFFASRTMPPPPVPGTAVRRQSLAPKAPTPSAGKPAPAPASKAAPRLSVASPDATSTSALKSSTARPRASVTEGVKRFVSGSKPAPAAAAVSRPPSTASVKGRSMTQSISSLKEVTRDDSKAIAELQGKLGQANDALSSNSETISGLENELETLKSDLQAAQAEVEAKTSALTEQEQAKAKASEDLAAARETLEKLQADQSNDSSKVQAVLAELQESKLANTAQVERIHALTTQIEALQAEVEAAKENLAALHASSDLAFASASAAAEAEHVALLKAQGDFEIIKAETEALKAAQNEALAAAEAKIKELAENTSTVDAFSAEIGQLKAENEEKANKVSELEVEILEIKEEQENAADEHSKTLARLQLLEAELAASAAVVQKALEDAQAKEAEYASKSEESSQAYREHIDKAAVEHADLQDKLSALQIELAQSIEDHDKAKANARAAAEAHLSALQAAEKLRQDVELKLNEEIARITAELESQETKYNAKVDAVKAEHEQLLQEAFEKAKNEAGDIHSQDLQRLRAESYAAIEQLRSGHQSAIDALQSEQQTHLEQEVKAREKQLATQTLELKATQEDLAKAKVNVASLVQELETTKAQLEDARQLVASLDKSDKDEIIAQLSRDISNLREDHAALNDMFLATKGSLGEMADNHVKELEEAAKGRAEEATKLRTVFQEEIEALTTEKVQLLTRLSDLEGELATVKSALATEPATPQKTNGTAHQRAQSNTQDDLQRLHEAHNLKMHDIQADHERVMRTLNEELEIARVKGEELQQEVARKAMEIQYLEQDQEESQDQITRLKEDLEHAQEQLKAKEDA